MLPDPPSPESCPAGHQDATAIRPNIYIGSVFDVATARTKFRCTHVLNLTQHAYKPPSGLHVQRPTLDFSPLLGARLRNYVEDGFIPLFEETVEYIQSIETKPACKKPRVLVHCDDMGAGQAAALVAAYLIWAESLSAEDAVRSVRCRRSLCFSSSHRDAYLRGLVDWEASLAKQPPNPDAFDACVRAAEEDATRFDPLQYDESEGASRGDAIESVEVYLQSETRRAPSPFESPKTRLRSLQRKDAVREALVAVFSDDVLVHRNCIEMEILQLSCPECSAPFREFSNCFSLWCSACGCAFCAFCRTSCRRPNNDATLHVSHCRFNTAPLHIFAPRRVFDRAQSLRRIRSLLDYVAKIEDGALRTQVQIACKHDLAELGITSLGASSEDDWQLRLPRQKTRTESEDTGTTAAPAYRGKYGMWGGRRGSWFGAVMTVRMNVNWGRRRASANWEA